MKNIVFKFVALLLLVVMLPMNVYAEEDKNVITLSVDTKVGKLKALDVTSYIDKDDSLSSVNVKYDTDASGEVAQISYSNGFIYVHGLSDGKVTNTIYFRSGTILKLDIRVTGEASKNKSYNNIDSVVGSAEGKNFMYYNIFMESARDTKGKVDRLYIHADVRNLNKDSKTPDIKVIFYNKNKKKVGTYQSSRDEGSTVNINLASGELYTNFMCGVSASGLGVSDKAFRSIRYFKICRL